MTDITATLKACHAIVWEARKELEHVWPTPTTEDALLFAFTELGEAIDAYLRTKPQYARNNAKDLDVLDELSDTCLMLLTAMGCDWEHTGWSRSERFSDFRWERLISHMAFCVSTADKQAMATLVRDIIRYPDMDLPARLTARLERIKAKRLPQEVAQ